MPTTLNRGIQGSAIAVGAANAFSPERVSERADARLRAEQRNQQLRTVKATKPTEADLANMAEAQSQELDNIAMQQRQTSNDLVRQSTYSAFERYDGGYDPRHLNNMFKDLQKTQAGRNLFGDVIRADKLGESDRRLMESQGLNADLIINDPEVAASYVKVTTASGETEVRSVDELKAETGYHNYAGEKELERQMRRARVEAEAAKGFGTTAIERESARRAMAEGHKKGTPEFEQARAKHYDELRKRQRSGENIDEYSPYGNTQIEREAYRRTALEGYEDIDDPSFMGAFQRNIDAIRDEEGLESVFRSKDEREAHREAIRQGNKIGTPEYDAAFDQAYNSIVARNRETATSKDITMAEEAQVKLDEMAGGDFFSYDLDRSNPGERAKFSSQIARIEKGLDVEIPPAERARMMEIKELIGLGTNASELTPNETGLIDRVFRSVSKYISDNVEGVAAEKAYSAYRNTVLHAFAGSALSKNERDLFVEAFGNLGQQAGPVLAGLKNNMEQLRSSYESIRDMNDPYVMYYRTGMDEVQLNNAIQAIDERLDLIMRTERNTPIPVSLPSQTATGRTTLTPERRQGLNALARDLKGESNEN